MKRASRIFGVFLLAYLLTEIGLSGYRYLFPALPPISFIFDGIDRTVRFDPVTGSRLTSTSMRAAQMLNGRVERIGQIKGNNQSFSGRHDFYPQRSMGMGAAKPDSLSALATARPARIAVLGDSLTAAWYFTGSWTDTVQDESQGELELLNFAQERTGLANWWRIVTQLIVPQRYQLDGVIFAVFGHDLNRRFTFYARRGPAIELYARSLSWNPASFPKSAEDAHNFSWLTRNAFDLSTEEFERALRGDWKPRRRGEFKLHLAAGIRDFFFPPTSEAERPAGDREATEPEREKMIRDLREFLQSHELPAMVVYIPNGTELLHRGGKESTFEDARAFGAAIGARAFVDGREAFAAMTPEEINANWLSHDLHFSQAGSDHFAGFMRQKLTSWRKSEPR